jgi:glycerophosphoryl diester phosphodiesterase
MTTRRILRRVVAALATLLASAGAAVPAAAQSGDPRIDAVRAALDVLDDHAQPAPCDQQPDPTRWEQVGTPDRSLADPLISAHRGALTLAPENTLASYEYAFAFGVPLVEVDVQQTKDGRFVALHDSTVDRTTDGTGEISTLTYDEVRRLNAADYEPWKGTEFDPSRVASMEQVLALARRVGAGIELDIKGSVTEEGELAELVASYGLIEESIYNSGDVRILQTAPGARFIYNRDDWEPPFLLWEIARIVPVFGSRLDEYTPESIAAIHDGCGVVMPHVYDAGPEQEVAQYLQARAIGADGAQTNQPERIVAAAGRPVPSQIVTRVGGASARVCLVNAENGLGFPTKQIELRKASSTVTFTAGLGGCAELPGPSWRGATAAFAGDGAVLASAGRVAPLP